MEIVLYTQRVEIVESYGERRDCADQEIPRFLEACGFLPVPLPNRKSIAEEIFLREKPAGILLTGGNSLVKYGGNAPERDEMEHRLIELAIEHKTAVYGFCRGMQVIADYFGCRLEAVEGHVAVRHRIHGEIQGEANSFHNQACKEIKQPLQVLAESEDGVIEAFACSKYRILGTMWHPEREKPFAAADKERVKKLFG